MEEEADSIAEIFVRDSFERSLASRMRKPVEEMVKEANPDTHDGLQWADSERDEVTLDDVDKRFGDEELMHSTMIYNRLITLLSGGAMVIHQTVLQECGHEVWSFFAQAVQSDDAHAGHPVDAAGRSTKARMCRLSSTSGRARRTRWSEVTESTPIDDRDSDDAHRA